MKTRILIATSEGPSEVQSLVPEDPDVACAVCLNGSTEALPITRGYHAFVRKPTGVIERMTGHKSYRMDVSASITNGESWQFGAYLAHALLEKDELALQGEAADRVWLVTGAVNAREETVEAVSHIQEKLDHCANLLKELQSNGAKVSYILPALNKADLTENYNLPIQFVEKATDILTPRNAVPQKVIASSSKSIGKMLGGAIILFVGIVGSVYAYQAGIFEQFLDQEKSEEVVFTPPKEVVETATVEEGMDNIPDTTPIETVTEIVEPETSQNIEERVLLSEAIDIQIFQLTAADGGSCAGRKYRDVILEAQQVHAGFAKTMQDSPNICGLSFAVKNKIQSALALTLKITSNPQDVLTKLDRGNQGEEISLNAGQAIQRDLALSLYRGEIIEFP